MRFAFVSTMVDWPWGGSEELWSQTAVQLKRAGHDVEARMQALRNAREYCANGTNLELSAAFFERLLRCQPVTRITECA